MKTALLNTVTKTKAENILSHWDILSNCLIETFRLTDEESVDLRKNKTAQLIAAIPFAAGCEEPLRTALAHLSIYMTELRGGGEIGGHNQNDNENLYARLRLLSSFKGGDRDIISHGLDMLAFIMVQGYFYSKKSDEVFNIYNPLNNDAWDYESITKTLLEKIHSRKCEVLDALFESAEPPFSW